MSFPATIFAALTPVPYLLAHLSPEDSKKPSLRANGRRASHFRSPTVNTNSLTHCNGSAVVRMGDTAVVCGVRAEILASKDIAEPARVALPADEEVGGTDMETDEEGAEEADADAEELAGLSLLVPNVELNTGCSPAFLPGNAPGTLAQSLAQRLLALLHSTRLIRAADLRVLHRPAKHHDDEEEPEVQIAAYWTLYMDILFISLDGNPFDAAWCALLAALGDTRLPRAWYDSDAEGILCSDAVTEARRLRLRGFPVPTSFAVFEPGREKGVAEERSWVLVDPDTAEEGVCDEIGCVVVDLEGGEVRIRRIEKVGGVVIGREAMKEVVDIAAQRWADWDGVLRG